MRDIRSRTRACFSPKLVRETEQLDCRHAYTTTIATRRCQVWLRTYSRGTRRNQQIAWQSPCGSPTNLNTYFERGTTVSPQGKLQTPKTSMVEEDHRCWFASATEPSVGNMVVQTLEQGAAWQSRKQHRATYCCTPHCSAGRPIGRGLLGM
jgi:hypothetical protein